MDGLAGFIGIGRMGEPMARRLLEAGHALLVHDRDEAAVARLVEAGAEAAPDPQAVADRAEVVFASLPTPPIVEAVALGQKGVVAGSRVRTFVDLSTTGPTVAVRIAEGLAEAGIVQVDAPVSGGVGGAEKGTLAVMVSGAPAAADPLVPMLQVFGKVFRVGEAPGQGQTMKLLNNLLSATAMVASAEAVVAGVKAGLDPAVMVDVINAGSGRSSATMDKFPKAILPRTFDYGFATGLMDKDVGLCLAEAERMGMPMPIAGAVRQMWLLARGELGPDSDFTEIVKVAEGWAGVTVAGR